jgi:hypothetical protein
VYVLPEAVNIVPPVLVVRITDPILVSGESR